MAGRPSSENSSFLGAGECSRSPRTRSSQPAPQDWEVLSMSTLSASTLGLPSQKPHESGTSADVQHRDEELTKYDAPIEPVSEGEPVKEGSSPDLAVHHSKDISSEREEMQPLVEPHADLFSAEGNPKGNISSDWDTGFSGGSSKKKTIKVSWWKRQVVIWQPQSYKYSAVFSIALVAAVVGIAVIGHRLHRERALNQQLRLELSAKEEKLNDMMYHMTGRRRIGVARNSIF